MSSLKTHHRSIAALAAGASGLALVAAAAVPARAVPLSPGVSIAPTTTTSPYVLPAAPGVGITSLLTVGDQPAGNGYAMVGLPDGLGLLAGDQEGSVDVLVNHEVRDTLGVARAHGQKGAFVSRFTIDTDSGAVTSGEDFISSVRYWNYSLGTYGAAPVAPAGAAYGHTAAFARFCSGFITDAGALTYRSYGYDGQIYLANEENGDEGRVFGVDLDGTAYQLPRLGLFSWENTLVSSVKSQRTVALGNEDGGSGQLWVYSGTKRATGNPVERAGLTNGRLFVMDVADQDISSDAQFRAKYGKGSAVPVVIGADQEIDWTKNGVAQNTEAAAKGLSLTRIEDGAFDPRNRNDYYFLTTEGGDKTANPAEPAVSRDGGGLWRLSFEDVTRPSLGATLTLLLDGSETPYLSKPDNMTIDRRGNLLIQEDPGGIDHVARIVAYRLADGARGIVAEFDPELFGASNTAGVTPADRAVLTTDEESSGIIDVAKQFGRGTFLFDAQVHTSKHLPLGTGPGTVEEFVEGGQLLLMRVRSWSSVYDS